VDSFLQSVLALPADEKGRVVVPLVLATQCCDGSVGHAQWCVCCWRAFPQSYLMLPLQNLVFKHSWDIPPCTC
jgi:hypothetical protein